MYPGFPDVSCCSAVDAMIDNDRMTFVGETGAKPVALHNSIRVRKEISLDRVLGWCLSSACFHNH